MSKEGSASSFVSSLVVGMLGILFVGLKLGGVIDWSWWWVTLPFWGGTALYLLILAVIGVTALALYLFGGRD